MRPSSSQSVVGLGYFVGHLVQAVLTNIFPALPILKKEIGSGYLGEEDIEVVIIHLYPSNGIQVWFSVCRALCEKAPVPLRY